jgi:hypothetical protein
MNTRILPSFRPSPDISWKTGFTPKEKKVLVISAIAAAILLVTAPPIGIAFTATVLIGFGIYWVFKKHTINKEDNVTPATAASATAAPAPAAESVTRVPAPATAPATAAPPVATPAPAAAESVARVPAPATAEPVLVPAPAAPAPAAAAANAETRCTLIGGFTPIWEVHFRYPEHYKSFKMAVMESALTLKLRFVDEKSFFLSGHAMKELENLLDSAEDKRLTSQFYNARRTFFRRKDRSYYFYDIWAKHPEKLPKLYQEIDLRSAEQELQKFLAVDINFFKDSPLKFDTCVETILTTRDFPGFIVGEIHMDVAPKKFLISRMKDFARLGVKTLFFEHIPHEAFQQDLDQFHNNGTMSQALRFYLTMLTNDFMRSKSPGYGYLEVVQEAQKNGIRVVAIDTEESYSYESDIELSNDRIVAMNYVANQIINQKKGDGKFVIFAGSAHTATYSIKNYLGHSQTPGLSEILGCPNIVIKGNHKTGQITEIANVEADYSRDESIKLHHLVVKVH